MDPLQQLVTASKRFLLQVLLLQNSNLLMLLSLVTPVKPQDTLKSTLNSMALEKSIFTAPMAQLEFDLVMGTAENGDTELLS